MKNENVIHEKAQNIRDVIRYIKKFEQATVIIYLDDRLIDSPIFQTHIKDICLIHDAGLKVIIVPGASKRIDEVLTISQIEWSFKNGNRITSPSAMPMIKMAAFDVSNKVMTALSAERKNALIGNWVRARGKGVIDGFDYCTSGEIDKLQTEAIETVLNNGFIPIFPCIGWSQNGKPYNISSTQLAEQIAIRLKADKLFYLIPNIELTTEHYVVPEGVLSTEDGKIPAMNQDELVEFIEINKDRSVSTEQSVGYSEEDDRTSALTLLGIAQKACTNGVSRVHLLDGAVEGVIPCEIFSDLGSGTMIYFNNYEKIREMNKDDATAVYNLIQPFVNKGYLLPRTVQMLQDSAQNYMVYELDGAIRACAALIPYEDNQAEIACLAVDTRFSHLGIGPKIINSLIERAKRMQYESIFLLTTQTADWFENLGFTESTIDSIPAKRRELWTPGRGSKVLRLEM